MAVDMINIATHGELEDLRSIANDISQAMSEDADLMNRRDGMGKSPLDIATMLGKTQIVQELISIGADIKTSTSNGTLV